VEHAWFKVSKARLSAGLFIGTSVCIIRRMPTTPTYTSYSGNWGFWGYPEAASLTTSLGSNKDLKYVADVPDSTGNSITVRYVAPGTASAALSVTVSGSAITVNLATDSGSAVTTTANAAMAAVNASGLAGALVTVSLAPGSNGTGVLSALSATPLTGGRTQGVGKGSTRPSVVAPRPSRSITRRF
jgi:hypothetical protein